MINQVPLIKNLQWLCTIAIIKDIKKHIDKNICLMQGRRGLGDVERKVEVLIFVKYIETLKISHTMFGEKYSPV